MTELPKFDLNGKTALITGAGRGLGRSISLAMAHAGAHVILGMRSQSDYPELVEEIRSMGRRVTAIEMDVLNLEDAAQKLITAAEQAGGLDILVNNAGGGIEGMALDVKPEDFDHVINLNVKSSFFLSQQAAQIMIDQKRGGRIINLSSQAGLVALPGEIAYCLAKAALTHMTRCMAVEWGAHNITVNSIAPTFIETPGTEEALSDPGFKSETIERIAALHRIGKPVEVAGAAVFLASDAASLITGHNLVVDGGWTLR